MAPRKRPSIEGGRTALLSNLESTLDQLPVALARGAKYVLENPEKVIHQSLAEMSAYSGSGEATILRLCRDLGFAGYTEFKIALSAELAVKRTNQRLQGDDDALSRIAAQLCVSIEDTRALLPQDTVDRIAARLKAARRIDVFGVGMSGLIGEMISYRLLRAGCSAIAMRDAVLAHEVSGGLNSRTAAIAISQSGSTPETIAFVQNARRAGAFAVAVTCHPRSALARAADETLLMARLKEPSFGGPITDVPRTVVVAEALALAIQAR